MRVQFRESFQISFSFEKPEDFEQVLIAPGIQTDLWNASRLG